MNKICNPEPADRSVDSEASAVDAEPDDCTRDAGSGDSSPACDPAAATLSAKSNADAHPSVVEDGEHGPRHARHPA